MRVPQLIKALNPACVEGPIPAFIGGIATEARLVKPGMAYVALRGPGRDGHQDIDLAIARGAVLVLCEKRPTFRSKAMIAQVVDTRIALAELARQFYGDPSSKLMVIGVVGEHGRGSVASLLWQILEKGGLTAGLVARAGCEVRDRHLRGSPGGLESLDVQSLLAQMVRTGCQAAVLEVGPEAIENHRVAGVHFHSIVSVGPLNSAPEPAAQETPSRRAQRKFLENQPAATRAAGVQIQVRDSLAGAPGSRHEMEVQIRHGLGRRAELRVERLDLRKDRTRFAGTLNGLEIHWEAHVAGRENAGHFLASAAAAFALGVSPDTIQSASPGLKCPSGNLEYVGTGHKCGVYVDGARSKTALRNAIRNLREITTGKILVAFGCGSGHDSEARFGMGESAAALADFTIITADNPGNESAAQIAAEVEKGFLSIRNTSYRIEPDRRKAILEIIGRGGAGDSVLIAGKGMETFQHMDGTIVPFDDREYAETSLRSRARGFAKEKQAALTGVPPLVLAESALGSFL